MNDDGTLRFLLEEKYVQPMALIERKEGDHEQLRRVFDFNERLEAGIAARIGERQERMGALLEGRAELEVLQKMLMTDDRGAAQGAAVRSPAQSSRPPWRRRPTRKPNCWTSTKHRTYRTLKN